MADSPAEQPVHKMGLIACISYVVGNVVGSGIFITPGSVLSLTRSIGLSLIIWLLCGLVSIIGGISYIELGTAIPVDGGDFAYATFVGWNAVAFTFMWVSALLTYPASTAVQATTFGHYLVSGVAQFVNIENRSFFEYGVAALLLTLCTLINCYSLEKMAARFQIVVTAAKALVLMVVVIIGAYWYFYVGDKTGLAHPMENSNYEVSSLVLAMYGGLWSYAGWDILNYGAPAVKNPKKILPLSLLGGLLVVTVTYVLVNTAYCAVLGTEQMVNSTAIASDFAQKSMGKFSVVVPFATALLLMGTINANIFCTSRIIYEASREGHLPKCLSAIHKSTGSPRAALIAQFFTSFVLMFININLLINYVTFVMWAQKLVTMCALLKIRYQKIEVDPGVMRVPLPISIVFLLICLVLVGIPFVTEFMVTTLGVLFVASGLVLYYIFVKPSKAYPIVEKMNDFLNIRVCQLLDSEIEEKPEASKECKESSEIKAEAEVLLNN